MTMHRIAGPLLAAVGVAHLLPATAVLSRDRVERAYGVTVPDPDTELLLRHRATFFGILGTALLAGSADQRFRWPAIAAGTASVGSFLVLAAAAEGPSAQLRRVQHVDVVLLAALGAAAACEALGARTSA
ncbi:hypothetical protein LB823_13015 [Tsukamurella sp. M9C]|uniref:hypothetical protein n=1 Tax=Tsukamurella sp. M9C TaxID=2877520 RepID=UPI001CCD4027|nr:hypothetical protein [Tsukamurella sp. M9C]MCA0157117.1 hypothetical protein [Tsukamurella sp. M9C]